MHEPTLLQSSATTPEDLAFDRAFREASDRELAHAEADDLPLPRAAFDTATLIERRRGFRRLVVWVVGSAGAITLIAMAISVVKAILASTG
jgi:hypothetical protein